MGGNPAALREFCRWQMELIDADRSEWRIRTVEAQHGVTPKLLQLNKLADFSNASKEGSYSRLLRMKKYDQFGRPDAWKIARAGHESLITNHSDKFTAFATSARYLTAAVPTAKQLAAVVREITEDMMLPLLPEASVSLIETDPSLSHRYGIVRALLPYENDPQLQTDDSRVFQSAKGLLDDTTMGLGAYLDTLVTSLSPYVWGLPVGRPGGVVLYSWGTTIPQIGLPNDPIQLHAPTNGRSVLLELPPIPASAFEVTSQWWVQQLDILLSLATEPANYCERGLYEPEKALEKVLTLEQFFRHCQSIATNTRDQHARRLVMFSALESLRGLSPKLDWHFMTSAERSRGTLEAIRQELPRESHYVLLPRAIAAVEALEDVQSGFFLKERLESGKLRLPGARGKEQFVSLDKATTLWLRLVRNSHHGFDRKPDPKDRALLAAHNGAIGDALADLAWLQLLHLMTHPQLLQRYAEP